MPLDRLKILRTCAERVFRLLRQAANLVRDHGETAAAIAGVRLDGGVQGNERRLLADFADGLVNGVNVLQAREHLAHFGVGLGDHGVEPFDGVHGGAQAFG